MCMWTHVQGPPENILTLLITKGSLESAWWCTSNVGICGDILFSLHPGPLPPLPLPSDPALIVLIDTAFELSASKVSTLKGMKSVSCSVTSMLRDVLNNLMWFSQLVAHCACVLSRSIVILVSDVDKRLKVNVSQNRFDCIQLANRMRGKKESDFRRLCIKF